MYLSRSQYKPCSQGIYLDLRGSGGGEETDVVEIEDMLLPLVGCVGLRVDVLDVVCIHLIVAVGNPTSLNFDSCSCSLSVSCQSNLGLALTSVAKKSWAVDSIDMEHVGIAWGRSSEVRLMSLSALEGGPKG